MRTTLTLDDQLAKSLKERAHQTRQSFKEVVNQALRLGLIAMDQPAQPVRYRLTPASLGKPRSGINLDKVLDIAGRLEDDAIANKLELRK